MFETRTVTIIFAAMLLCGCYGWQWPPYEPQFRENFDTHSQSFDRLAKKIREDDVCHVSVTFGSRAKAAPCSEKNNQSYVVEDDTEWYELLEKTGSFLVHRNDNGSVSIESGGDPFDRYDNRLGYGTYVHDPDMLPRAKICAPGYKDIPCGYCVVNLGTDWYLRYAWYQEVFDSVQWEAYLNGTLSSEAYSEERDKALNQCMVDGYEEMGYTATQAQ